MPSKTAFRSNGGDGKKPQVGLRIPIIQARNQARNSNVQGRPLSLGRLCGLRQAKPARPTGQGQLVSVQQPPEEGQQPPTATARSVSVEWWARRLASSAPTYERTKGFFKVPTPDRSTLGWEGPPRPIRPQSHVPPRQCRFASLCPRRCLPSSRLSSLATGHRSGVPYTFLKRHSSKEQSLPRNAPPPVTVSPAGGPDSRRTPPTRRIPRQTARAQTPTGRGPVRGGAVLARTAKVTGSRTDSAL